MISQSDIKLNSPHPCLTVSQESFSQRLAHLEQILSNNQAPLPTFPAPQPLVFKPQWSAHQYQDWVQQHIEGIKQGTLAEINFTQRYQASLAHDQLYPNYLALRKTAQACFGSYQNLGNHQLLLASPETFFIANGADILTRPIKGTMTTEHAANTLQHSPKNRAENLMIVDLMRNDFAKICSPESIQAHKICAVNTLPHLHQLYSEITGQLTDDHDHVSALMHCFPAGSITGTPKIKAIEETYRTEQIPRGPYWWRVRLFWLARTKLNLLLTFAAAIPGNKTFTITQEVQSR